MLATSTTLNYTSKYLLILKNFEFGRKMSIDRTELRRNLIKFNFEL